MIELLTIKHDLPTQTPRLRGFTEHDFCKQDSTSVLLMPQRPFRNAYDGRSDESPEHGPALIIANGEYLATFWVSLSLNVPLRPSIQPGHLPHRSSQHHTVTHPRGPSPPRAPSSRCPKNRQCGFFCVIADTSIFGFGQQEGKCRG
jgi:hypothetical protein